MPSGKDELQEHRIPREEKAHFSSRGFLYNICVVGNAACFGWLTPCAHESGTTKNTARFFC